MLYLDNFLLLHILKTLLLTATVNKNLILADNQKKSIQDGRFLLK